MVEVDRKGDTPTLTAGDNNKPRIVGILEQLVDDNRHKPLEVLSNRAHYFNTGLSGGIDYAFGKVGPNDPKGFLGHKNPVLSDLFDESIRTANELTQTTIVFEKTLEMSARMTEHHYIVNLTNPDILDQSKSDEVSEMLNAWAPQMEKRSISTHQQGMSNAQLVDCSAVLHLRRMGNSPEIPEPEYMDEPADAENFEDNPDRIKDSTERAVAKDPKFTKKMRHTHAHQLERLKTLRARAGCPYQIDVVDRAKFYGSRDKLDKMVFGAVIERQGFWKYDDGLQASSRENDTLKVFLEQADKMHKLRVYGPEERPEWAGKMGDRSGGMLKNITIARLETRDSWYELISAQDLPPEGAVWNIDDWELVKSGDHTWDRTPFFPCDALKFNGVEMPALEALFRNKPAYDRQLAIFRALSEQYAINEIVMLRGPGADDETTARGNRQGADEDADGIKVLPREWKPMQINIEVSSAAVRALEISTEALESSSPPTGFADISASTKPWTAQLSIAQESLLLKMMVANQAETLTEVYTTLLRDMSLGVEAGGLADEFWAYKKSGDGSVKQLLGAKATDIETLQVSVSINATTSSEQITLTQVGAELLGLKLITKLDFYQNFMKKENASDYISDLDAETLVNIAIPALLQLAAVKEWGGQFVIGSDLLVAQSDITSGTAQPTDVMGELNNVGLRPLEPTTGDLSAQTAPGTIPEQPVIA